MLIDDPAIDAAADLAWRSVDLSSPDAIERAAAAGEDIIRASGHGGIEHDVRWLAARADSADKSVALYVAEADGRTVGYAPLFIHPSQLRYALGDLTLLSIPVRRSVIAITPLVRPGWDDADGGLAEDFVVWLRPALGGDEVIFLEGLRQGCPLYRALTTPGSRLRRAYHVVRFGPLYEHRSIRFDGGYDDYLGSLGAKTRADLRRTRRRFADRVAGRYETRRFTRADEVDAFVADAMRISVRTWQFNRFGAGLRDETTLVERFRRTAALGWFRSYILYVDGEPVAFQVGHLYDNTYFAQEIGYDPAWRRMQVGIFLHTEIVPDLLARQGDITAWDFGNTDTLHKQRLGNRSEPAGFFYLVPNGVRGALIGRSMIWMNGFADRLGRVLDRLELRATLRAALTRLGAAK